MGQSLKILPLYIIRVASLLVPEAFFVLTHLLLVHIGLPVFVGTPGADVALTVWMVAMGGGEATVLTAVPCVAWTTIHLLIIVLPGLVLRRRLGCVLSCACGCRGWGLLPPTRRQVGPGGGSLG